MALDALPHATLPALPGARASCALLTIFTILLAWPSPTFDLGVVVSACYFALLSWFFWRTGRASPQLHGQAMRLVTSGFVVLWLSFTVSALIHFLALEPRHTGFAYLREVCEKGALFLLGTTLISYGLMLWIPQVLVSHRLLGEHFARQRGELQVAESTRSQLEQRLLEADRRGMLGELAASIAHDLRNPLTIVKGTAESLCRRPRTSAEIAEHTEVIRRNIEKADRTIASLIDLGRPRASDSAELSPSEVFADIIDLLQVEARRRQAHLVVHGGLGPEPRLRADRTLLAQALLNLVLNALEATSPDGRIVLRARAVQRGSARWTALAIEDRGSGVHKTVRPHLFTPFFTTKADGTGLGLSSCRRIASELGGRLCLYPRLRGGARALLMLPAASNDDSPTERMPADEGQRCLVPTS
ncbi:MAG: HAMP domain-containing sensor histidine kinase [Planctomycetota bacterium]